MGEGSGLFYSIDNAVNVTINRPVFLGKSYLNLNARIVFHFFKLD